MCLAVELDTPTDILNDPRDLTIARVKSENAGLRELLDIANLSRIPPPGSSLHDSEAKNSVVEP